MTTINQIIQPPKPTILQRIRQGISNRVSMLTLAGALAIGSVSSSCLDEGAFPPGAGMSSCLKDTDCPGEELCIDNICSGSCLKDTDCPGDYVCEGRMCVEGESVKEDITVKTEVTNANGNALFTDKKGELVTIAVENADNGSPLENVSVSYFGGDKYEVYSTIDNGSRYLPSLGIFTHNSTHKIKMCKKEEHDYCLNQIITDGEVIEAYYSWKNSFLEPWNRQAYVDTLDDDEKLGVEGVDGIIDLYQLTGALHTISCSFSFAITPQWLVDFVNSTDPRKANVHTSALSSPRRWDLYVTGKSLELESSWSRYLFVPLTKSLIESNIPSVNLERPVINGSNATLRWEGFDSSEYQFDIDPPTKEDITVYLGPTNNPDLEFEYKINFLQEWISVSNQTNAALPPLPKGAYSAQVRVTDEVGNQSLSNSVDFEIRESGSSCSDECAPSGEKQCFGNGWKQCGDYDTDNCLEWSSLNRCAADENCVDARCVEEEQECNPARGCDEEGCVFYDGFDGNSLDTECRWNQRLSQGGSVQDSIIESGRLRSQQCFPYNSFELEFRWRCEQDFDLNFGLSESFQGGVFISHQNSGRTLQVYCPGGGRTRVGRERLDDGWHTTKIVRRGGGSAEFYVDDGQMDTLNCNNRDPCYPLFMTSNGHCSIDYIKLKNL